MWMIPFTIYNLKNDAGVVLINCSGEDAFGLSFISSTTDVHSNCPIEILGGLYYIQGVLDTSEDNINIGCLGVEPLDSRSRSLFRANTNQYQYVAGEKVRMAFKEFEEEKPNTLSAMRDKLKEHRG